MAPNAGAAVDPGPDRFSHGFVTQEAFDEANDVFEELEGIADGSGPVFSAQACRDCHHGPTTGGAPPANPAQNNVITLMTPAERGIHGSQ